MTAVCPFHASVTLGSAPRASNRSTVFTLPVRAQVRSGGSPDAGRPGSAPASSSCSTRVGFALTQASDSEVAPWALARLTSAAAAMRRAAISASSRYAAQCSAVVPSGSAVSTATPARSRSSTPARSPARAASVSRLSAPPAPSVARTTTIGSHANRKRRYAICRTRPSPCPRLRLHDARAGHLNLKLASDGPVPSPFRRPRYGERR